MALALVLTLIPSAFASGTVGNLNGNIIEIDGTQIAGATTGLGSGANLYPDGYTGAPYSAANPAPTSPHLNANANIDWVKTSTGNTGTGCLRPDDIVTCDQAGVTASTNGAGDWNGIRIVDGIGNNDQDIFVKGGKENDTSTWTIAPGSVGSAKYDITQAYVANTSVSNTSGYLFFGMERRGNDGTTAFDFEFNAQAPAAGNQFIPTRTVGDVLFTFEMQGSGSSGSAVPHVFTWNGSAYVENTNLQPGEVVTSINDSPTPGAPWGFVNSKGNWTDSSATNSNGMLGNFEFAEAAVKIGAGGVALPGVGACGGTAFSEVRTRSSATSTSDLKDTTKIFPFNFGSPQAAATLAALCPPTQGSAPQFSYDGTASTNSSGGTTGLTYSWNITVSPSSVTLSGGGVSATATPGQYTSSSSHGTVDVTFPADISVTQASVTVKNTVSENGACSNATGNLTVTVFRALGATATLAPTCGFDVSYSSTVSGGLAPYTYAWAFFKVGAGAGGADLQVGTSTTASGTFNTSSSGAGAYYGKLTVTDSADTTNFGTGVTGKGACVFNVTSNIIQVFGPLNPTATKSGQDGSALQVTGDGAANAATLLQWQYQDGNGVWHDIAGASATSATASLTTAPTLKLNEPNFRDPATNIAKSVTSATATIGSAPYVGQLYTIVLRLHAVRSAAAGGTTGDCTADSASVTVTLFIGVDP